MTEQRRGRDPDFTAAICPHFWCRQQLPVSTDWLGRTVVLPCERCARRAQGICYSCPTRIAALPITQLSQSPIFCKSCRRLRRRGISNKASQTWRRRNRKDIRQSSKAAYALNRDAISAKKRKRRRDNASAKARRTRDYSTPKTRPCGGCGAEVVYYSRPPLWCDRCWLLEADRKEAMRRKRERARKLARGQREQGAQPQQQQQQGES